MSFTITQSRAERTAHSYAGSLYLLPSDEEERQRYASCLPLPVTSLYLTYPSTLIRLLAQHQLYTRILSGRLIIPPISLSEKDEVLDIGTGAGKPSSPLSSYLAPTTSRPHMKQVHGSPTPVPTSQKPSNSTASTSNHACSPTTPPSHPTSISPSAPPPISRPTGPPNLPSSTNVSSSALTPAINGNAASTKCSACSHRGGTFS